MPKPRELLPDSTIALWRDPYRYISKKCRELGRDAFTTRILLQPAICMTGREAAKVFYDPARFQRAGANPGRLQKSLFGRGGVQGLDGEAHRERKALLLSIVSPERVAELRHTLTRVWREQISVWALANDVVLYEETQQMLMRAVCEWAGVPLAHHEVAARTRELTALFDGAGAVGPRHWWSRLSRHRADRWVAGIIDDVRAHRVEPRADGAAYAIAWHRDCEGTLLPAPVAAVELLGVLRPTVAVSVFIVQAALALHRNPQCRRQLEADEPDYEDCFVEEVRRFYPFFPAVAARAKSEFRWQELRFRKGQRVLFDLYGTNHDARIWSNPEVFQPERFRSSEPDAWSMVPQGGGRPDLHHRCPGESVTVELMKVAVRMLAGEMRFEVPPQDLSIDMARMPALPRSRFVMRGVYAAGANLDSGAPLVVLRNVA